MFGGEYRHSKDSKNRVFMPAKLREELGETFVIAKDIREACLKVYSLSGWEEYIAPLKAQNRKLSEKILRFLHASLTQVTPDSQGRVTSLWESPLIRHSRICPKRCNMHSLILKS